MIGQTTPVPPEQTTTATELAATGGPEWLVPAVMIGLVLLLVGAALVRLAAWRSSR